MRSQDWRRLVGRIIHGNTCDQLVTKESSIFNARRSTYFQILYCVLERSDKRMDLKAWNGSKSMGAKIWMDQIFSKLKRLWRNHWRADWIRVDHFPGFTTLQLYGKVTDLLSSLGETETFTRRILFMSMFNDISCDKKDHGKECLANEVVSIFANKLGIRQWSFVGPSSEKKWFSVVENGPQRIWDIIEEKILVEFADSGCPIFRVTTPLSRCNLKSKGHGKLSIHFAADQETIETVQLNLYGTVAKTCEECESLHDRSGKPDMVMGQSIVLSEIKTEVPLENDDRT